MIFSSQLNSKALKNWAEQCDPQDTWHSPFVVVLFALIKAGNYATAGFVMSHGLPYYNTKSIELANVAKDKWSNADLSDPSIKGRLFFWCSTFQ